MGPIRVSSNGRYFVDEGGRPFFWLGDTQWQLFRDLSTEDAKAVLKRRAAQGFSAIQVMVTGVGDGARPNITGQTPWTGHDPASPNEAYFERADRIVEAADSNGLVLVLGVFHRDQVSRITLANARAYARWLAQRYRHAPNVIWTMYPEAKPESVPVLRELAAGLQEGDGAAHLITVHPDPAPASSSFIHEEPWLAFNMIQTCVRYELIHEMVSADYARMPAKPTVMAEGGYEGVEFSKVQTALEIRTQAYWSYLAGGHHSYGHNDNWTTPSTWPAWIDSPGAQHMGLCRQILTACREWWKLVPDRSLFVAGQSSGLTLNTAARSPAGDWALVYLSAKAAVDIRMDRVTAGTASEAFWIDPTTGARTRIGRLLNSGVRTFSTPDAWADALLVFEKQDPR